MMSSILFAMALTLVSDGAVLPTDPEHLRERWRLELAPVPSALDLPAQASGCAVIAFTIDRSGEPLDLQVVHSHPDARFGEAASRLIALRRYAPGPKNPRADSERTFEILSFGQRRPRTGSRVGGSVDPAVFAPCDLDADEVAARLAKMRAAR